jgi:hypothetical protein
MKTLSILFITLLMQLPLFAGQSGTYDLFRVNESKSQTRSAELSATVEGLKVVDVDMNSVRKIIQNNDEYINIRLPFEGTMFGAKLKRFEILAPGSRIVSGTPAGDILLKESAPFVAYTSDLYDKNSPLVVITFFNDDVSALIITNQDTYVLAKQKSTGDFVSYQASKMKLHPDFHCGADEFGIPKEIEDLQKNVSPTVNSMASNTLLKANIAIESDYDTYINFGNSVDRVSNYIIALYVPVSAIYVRDVNVQLQITYLRVWTDVNDPYPVSATSGPLLDAFRAYWNANMQAIPRTLAHFVTTRPGGLGGVAWLNSLCASVSSGYGYAFSDIDGTFNQLPTYSWDCMVVAHETGHNFGSPHTHSCTWPGGPIDSCYATEGGCYTGPAIARVGTIMSYCHLNGSIALYFGPLPTNLIRTRAEVASCLNTISGFLLATPNGGQIFRANNTPLVIWGTSNTGNVDIQYTINNGANWVNIAVGIPASQRSIDWLIPNISTTTQAKVRVFETGNPSNGDMSDSTFQIRAFMNAFTIVDPPQLYRTSVSAGDTSRLHFSFTRSGYLPEFKYKWTLSTINNAFSYTSLSNNSGNDSVFSITKGKIDSLMSLWGAPNVGDSLRVRWSVKAYSTLDSVPSSNQFLITFQRGLIGIQQISSNVPSVYFITPNYPNPFNPTTRIKFGIPSASVVKLSVYDMLGKQVDLLVNSSLQAGEYEADWNAGNFASGIYIYKIEARDNNGKEFIQTKKMVLVK